MPVMASLLEDFGFPWSSMSLPPHEPSGSWLALSQFSPRIMAASVMSFPPPERRRAIRFCGSQRCCMVFGKLKPIPLSALFMASLLIPTLPVEGADALTTGAKSLTSSSLKSGRVMSDIAVVRNVCWVVLVFCWRCISFTTFCFSCFFCAAAGAPPSNSASPSPPSFMMMYIFHMIMKKMIMRRRDMSRLLSNRYSLRYFPNALSSGGATIELSSYSCSSSGS